MEFKVWRAVPLAVLLLGAGCASYTLKTTAGTARDVPDKLYGLGPGPTTRAELNKGGWAFAEKRDGGELYVLGSAVTGVSEIEAIVKAAADDSRTVQFIRLKYARTRLATYRELVNKLTGSYGPPQSSREMPTYELFDPDPSSDAPRPPRYIVHEWRGPHAALVLAAGLEDSENLLANMQYQLFLLPTGSSAPTGN